MLLTREIFSVLNFLIGCYSVRPGGFTVFSTLGKSSVAVLNVHLKLENAKGQSIRHI